MKKLFPIFMVVFTALLWGETLFEVKDALNNKVLDVSTDGLRIMNQGDTLMVISSNEIRANISSSKGLSRTFSVTTNAAKGQGIDLMRLTADSTRFWISDSGSGFGVSSLTAAKEKSVATDFLKVSNANTEMREGTVGNRYTDFSPSNMFLGLNAGINTTGVGNVFIGNQAGMNNTVTSQNTFIGQEAGKYTDAGGNTFVGYGSGWESTGGGNTYYGVHSGAQSGAGQNNNVFGSYGGMFNTGRDNSIFGRMAGYGVEGVSNYTYNCLFGNSAGNKLTTGGANVMLGSGAGGNTSTGYQNVFVGHNAGDANTTGQENVYIGSSSAYSNSTGSKNVFIGDGSGYYETGSERLYIENSYSSSPLIYGEFDNDLLRVNGDLNVTGAVTLDSILTVNDVTMLNDNPLYLKSSSSYSGLRYREYWGATYVDGPTLFGENGGALGTANGAIALRWSYYDGNVTVPTGNFTISAGRLKVPSIYSNTVGLNGRYVKIDSNGNLYSTLSKDGDYPDSEEIQKVKEANAKLENEIAELRRELSEIKRILIKDEE